MVKSGTATSKRAGKIAVREAGEDKEDDKTSEVETESPAPEEANEVVGLPENIEPKESEEVLMNSDAKEDGNEDVGTLKEADNDSVEEKDKEEVRDGKVVQEHQMDTTPGPVIEAKKVTVTWKSENAMETMTENSEVDHVDEQNGNVTPGKRKAESTVETSPSKKMMFINDDFCLFVGNLNKSKKLEEIKDSLANFFKTHSLFIQDIRLDRSRRFGYIDFSTEEDLKKALELNGEKVLDNQLKLDKAKVKEIVANDKNAKDARTLFVKNLPLSATKEDLKNVFDKAVDFRFPVGFDCSSKGFAYVEFKTEAIAEKELEEKQGIDVKGRVIIIDFMGKKSNQKAQNAPDDITPSNTLIVCNLAYTTKEYVLKKVFVKAVSIRIPQRNGKTRGYAFIVFGSVDDAKDAMELSQNKKICGRAIRIEYSKFEQRPQHDKASSVISKTLFVRGLAEETSDETLKSAFEGAIAACVNTDKDTRVSRGFGFINFESQEDCKAAKEAMEDCEIDGSKVSLAYAISNGERGLRGDRGGFRGRPGSYGRGGGGKGFRGRGGNRGGRGGGFGKKSQDGKDGRKTVTS